MLSPERQNARMSNRSGTVVVVSIWQQWITRVKASGLCFCRHYLQWRPVVLRERVRVRERVVLAEVERDDRLRPRVVVLRQTVDRDLARLVFLVDDGHRHFLPYAIASPSQSQQTTSAFCLFKVKTFNRNHEKMFCVTFATMVAMVT